MWAIILLLIVIITIVAYVIVDKAFKQHQYHCMKEFEQRFTVTPSSNSINYYKFKRNL